MESANPLSLGITLMTVPMALPTRRGIRSVHDTRSPTLNTSSAPIRLSRRVPHALLTDYVWFLILIQVDCRLSTTYCPFFHCALPRIWMVWRESPRVHGSAIEAASFPGYIKR